MRVKLKWSVYMQTEIFTRTIILHFLKSQVYGPSHIFFCGPKFDGGFKNWQTDSPFDGHAVEKIRQRPSNL